MKRVFIYGMLVYVVVSLAGCAKYLDKQPDNLLTSDMIWQKRSTAESYLYQVYSHVQLQPDDYTTLGASDETACSLAGLNVRKMNAGNWSAQSYYWNYWPDYYSGIRQSFVFEQNIDKVPPQELGDELKNQYKSEVLFLRGWFYWRILRQYGPFVILRNILSLNEDFSNYTRAPFDSCLAEINRLMDRAAGGLPASWESSSNYGRPTKGTCLAVKSQAALLAASPLWNGNTLFASLKNNDGTPLAPAGFDADKWRVAAAAAKAVIDLNTYKLYVNTDDGDAVFDPLVSYRNVFISNWNSEIIFSSNLAGNPWIWGWEKRCNPGPGGINMQNATQNIVDIFYMRNGRTIDDPASGYAEDGFVQTDDPAKWGQARDGINRGYIAGNSNMYVNREARFYAAIQYNGKPVISAPTSDDRNYFSSDPNKDGRGRAEFYYNGKSGTLATNTGDITGYLVQKGANPASNIRNDQAQYRPYIHLRYAEILLNYIEALNEYDPGNPDVLRYLNAVRSRGGLPAFETVYPNLVGNTAEMRKVILRERQIELCFEGDRYFTLTRRMMMGDTKNRAIYRMNVMANDNGQGFSFAGFYTRNLLETRFWADRMYLFPIAQDDMDKSRGLVQNPGW
ncbi:RagB/SusD family nutrient uptake outer membrane protein [Niabella beijingensis]|uniref:RagB/SusD family nutrient uptake outer membrane protein n=1 Tax=Niabella beijingensis TaxID=2872700 RepID=UPI001CBAD104|nr:RagB/SusD family nutrient uptake outer membrane protein [Niabella beijingensis]MBZ4190599.1 RagB/SusD family nutrient uptake outer membrane protein [Niabella beijingensis]